MSLQLYPFQQYTIDRLKDVRSSLIGDDMGLGKTIQAIALDVERRKMSYEWEKGKTLVLTPLGVIPSWKTQFERWSDLKVITINNRNRLPFEEAVEFGTHDVYVMHWDALRLMPVLAQQKWFHVIGDEIHKIQNRKTKVSLGLKEIEATFKTGLSGTPAYDKPDDLWSVLNWLYPTYWTSYWNYFGHHVLWVDYNGYKQTIGVANQDELQEKMRGFYIRRKKEEVLTDLPDKYHTERFVDLTPKQRRAYNQMRDSMLSWVGENEDKPVNASVVVAQLTRLQQFASAHAEIIIEHKPKKIDVNLPRAVESWTDQGYLINKQGYVIDRETKEKVLFPVDVLKLADPSSKLDVAMEILDSTNRQVVFFSQFSQIIDLFCERMDKAGITYGKYTGGTNTKDRQQIVDGFKAGKIRVFAGTLGAGGTGLDGLQVADTVVFFDRAWSHSTNEQAIARLHRIGQKNAVHVIDLIATGTIERKRIEKINLEWQWIKELLGEEDK